MQHHTRRFSDLKCPSLNLFTNSNGSNTCFCPLCKTLRQEIFCHKIALKRGYRFDHNNWYAKNMERPFFPTEIQTRRELAGFGFSKSINLLHSY